jgi:hypothetical protein
MAYLPLMYCMITPSYRRYDFRYMAAPTYALAIFKLHDLQYTLWKERLNSTCHLLTYEISVLWKLRPTTHAPAIFRLL